MKTNCKLINLSVWGFVFCILTLLPLISEAAYKIYLKNGRVIKGVEEIKQEGKRIKIYKSGIMLELSRSDILNIEEYKTGLAEEETAKEKTPVESELPEYLRYKEHLEVEPIEKPSEKIPQEGKPEEIQKEEEKSKKKPLISQKHIESLPPTKQSENLKKFIKKLPKEAVGP